VNKLSTRLSALALAALVLTTACGEDTTLEPTFGEACNRGSLSSGETVEGSLSPASCRGTYHLWSGNTYPYESWTVHLDAGKAYMFHMQQIPDPAQDGENSVDALLTLWGKDDQGRSVPLAVSDDDAAGVDGVDSEFWFIAPESGDFQLVAAAYEWDYFGGYRLSMTSCPVLGILDTAGTYHYKVPSSPCVRHDHESYGDHPMTYAFIGVNAESFEYINFETYSDVSTPYYEIGGPGFDTYANIWEETESDYGYGVSGSISMTTDEVGGMVTFAVGLENFNAGGEYIITFGREPAAAPIPAPWRDGRFTLRSTFPKAEAKNAAKH